MKIIHRYIAKTLFVWTFLVMIVVLAIYGFFKFITELNSVGNADYTVFLAMTYVLLDLPSVLSETAPAIILLGAILGMSHLARTSQIIVFRASNMSIIDLSKIVLAVAFSWIMVIMIITESIIPSSSKYAHNIRSKALSHNVTVLNKDGFWLKEGGHFINAKNHSDESFADFSIIKINNNNQLDELVFADTSSFNNEKIHLKNAISWTIDHQNKNVDIDSKNHQQYPTKLTFDKDIINATNSDLSTLSLLGLYRQISFLGANNLVAGEFKNELIKRLIRPFALVAMILLSLLFLFGSTRLKSHARNIFLGIIIALMFELSSRIFAAISIGFGYNFLLTSTIPILLVIFFASLHLFKISNKLY